MKKENLKQKLKRMPERIETQFKKELSDPISALLSFGTGAVLITLFLFMVSMVNNDIRDCSFTYMASKYTDEPITLEEQMKQLYQTQGTMNSVYLKKIEGNYSYVIKESNKIVLSESLIAPIREEIKEDGTKVKIMYERLCWYRQEDLIKVFIIIGITIPIGWILNKGLSEEEKIQILEEYFKRKQEEEKKWKQQQ